MNKNKLVKLSLTLGGLAEIGLGTGHFIMPRFILASPEFQSLPKIHLDFVIHATIAVGLCLFVFGFLSLFFSTKIGEKVAKIFALSQAVLWIIRLVTEFIYPIKVPMFGINNMSNLIIIGVVLIIVSFLLPVFLTERN